MDQNSIFVLGVTRIPVGLSAIVKVSVGAYEQAGSFKILSGGGTLEIVNGTTSGGAGWGTGYPLGVNEVMNFVGPATFYLASTSATMVCAFTVGYSVGATIV